MDWIWLAQALGPGSPWAGEALRSGLSPKELYRLARAGNLPENLSEPLRKRLAKPLGREQAAQWEARIESCGVQVIPFSSPDYPPLLRGLASPPLVLYAWGDMGILRDSLCIGLVGPRKATPYGLEAARSISRDLAACKAHPVSGHALGIDSAVHEGALAAGGGSVMVLACGHDRDYPKNTLPLRREVAAQGGAVISETLPGEPFHGDSFEKRNRLLAGISMGVVVVEAGEHSGALDTARQAGEQGRDLFCVPGSIFEPNQAGVAKLLREGARPVTGAADILAEYFPLYPERIEAAALDALEKGPTRRLASSGTLRQTPPPPAKKPAARHPAPERQELDLSFLPPEARALLQKLESGKAHIDELAASLGENGGKCLAALTELEILGLVKSLPGGYYEKA